MPVSYVPIDVPPRRRLYIRKEYEELYTELLHLYEQGDGAEPALVDIIPEGDDNQHDIQSRRFWMLYLGNPGTGKSLAGLVLLFLFVKKGVTVVYYMHKLCPGAYLLFQKGKLVSVIDFGEATQYLVDPSVIYIHDGGELTGTGFIKAATLLIATPDDPKVYKEFVKVSGGHAIFYGRLWSMEELHVCWRMVYWARLSWDSVLSNIYYVGRIPRLAFVAADQFKPVREAVKGEISTTAGLVQLLSLVGQHIGKTFSNQLLHLDREKDPLSIYTRIASEYVIEQSLLQLPAEQWCQAVLKYKNLPGVTALAELRGSIMELLMHLTFPKFLSFGERICDGVHGGEHVLKAPHFDAGELRVFYYSSFDDLLEKIKVCRTVKHRLVYFWPRMRTEAALDSIYIDFVTGTAYLLQSTLSSKRHLIVWSPIKKLCSYFSSEGIYVAGLYFVTSPSNYAGFKCQGWKKSRAVRDEHESLQKMPRLCQYKVRFEMHAEDLENIPKLTMFEKGIHANLKALAGWPEKHVRSQGVISEEEHMSKRPRLATEQGSQLPHLRKACQSSYFDDSFFDTDDKFIQEDVEDNVSLTCANAVEATVKDVTPKAETETPKDGTRNTQAGAGRLPIRYDLRPRAKATKPKGRGGKRPRVS